MLIFIPIATLLFFNTVINWNQNRSADTIPVRSLSQTGEKKQLSAISIVAQDLKIPWSLVFLPDGSMLFTEREGQVRKIDRKNSIMSSPIGVLSQVKAVGEGGLLGITIHPDFIRNSFVYLYYTYKANNQNTVNRVSQFIYTDDALSHERVIVDTIPGAANHNGGRIKFGPDGFLYITTGDAQEPSRAQDIHSLAGKILRVTDEGKPAPQNPFNNHVYSFGHRNPQGIAWDEKGRLWATEHGRSGLQSGLDEINLIERGKNYGWPVIQGDEKKEHMVSPVLHSGVDTWAPAGGDFIGASLFFGGLRGKALYEAFTGADTIVLRTHFLGEFGRMRDVVRGPDKALYITTSNRDGRGDPKAHDDKIIKVYLSQ